MQKSSSKGFTLIELLVVITIIGILAGLILSAAGYIQKKGARSRAEAEIAALSAALESYKADMGDYPGGTNVAPATNNAFLRAALMPSGSNALNTLNRVYFEFTKGMSSSGANPTATNVAVLDPFGGGYGYRYPGTNNGSNFFDLWSTAGSSDSNTWIKNW